MMQNLGALIIGFALALGIWYAESDNRPASVIAAEEAAEKKAAADQKAAAEKAKAEQAARDKAAENLRQQQALANQSGTPAQAPGDLQALTTQNYLKLLREGRASAKDYTQTQLNQVLLDFDERYAAHEARINELAKQKVDHNKAVADAIAQFREEIKREDLLSKQTSPAADSDGDAPRPEASAAPTPAPSNQTAQNDTGGGQGTSGGGDPPPAATSPEGQGFDLGLMAGEIVEKCGSDRANWPVFPPGSTPAEIQAQLESCSQPRVTVDASGNRRWRDGEEPTYAPVLSDPSVQTAGTYPPETAPAPVQMAAAANEDFETRCSKHGGVPYTAEEWNAKGVGPELQSGQLHCQWS